MSEGGGGERAENHLPLCSLLPVVRMAVSLAEGDTRDHGQDRTGQDRTRGRESGASGLGAVTARTLRG